MRFKGPAILFLSAAAPVVVVSFFLSPAFELARSIEIKAHPIKVYLQIGELKNWPRWWPWARHGQYSKFEFGPATNGVGATASWRGRPAPGRVTITSANPSAGIGFDCVLDGRSHADKGAFEFSGTASGAIVTWRFKGRFETPVLGGYLALIADSMHGGMLDWGLGRLKEVVEADKRDLFFGEADAGLARPPLQAK